MKRILCTSLLLLLAASGWSRTTVLSQSDFPRFRFLQSDHSSDQWDTLVFNQDISTASYLEGLGRDGGFYLSASNIVILGNGHKLIYNTNETDGNGATRGSSLVGLFIDGTRNVIVRDLTIEQYSANGAWTMGVRFGGNDKLQLINCNVHARGPNSKCVYAGGDFYNCEIDGGNYTSYVRRFNSRCMNDGGAIIVRADEDVPDTSAYHAYIHNIVIDSCPNWAVTVRGKCLVDSNTIYLNSVNENFDPNVSCGVCDGTGNSYGISIGGCHAGTKVRWNTIRVYDTFAGGRGIYVDETSGTEANPIEVAYNDVDISEGPGCYTGENNEVYAFRARWGNHHLRVHHNRFVATVDTDPGTTHIGRKAVVMYITEGEGSRTGDHNYYYSNYCEVKTSGVIDGEVTMYAMNIENNDYDPSHLSIDNRSFNNYLKSPGICMKLGGLNGGASNWTSISDTFYYETPYELDGYRQTGPVVVGYYNKECTTNVFVDPVFATGETEEDVVNGSTNSSSSREAYWQRDLDFTVVGNNGQRVSGANVQVENRYGHTVLNGYTVNGVVEGALNYDFDRWVGSSHSDSTYNNFTVTIQKDGDVTSQVMTIDLSTNEAPEFILDGTVGEVDSVGPGQIIDLSATTSSESGKIRLNWSAPGDDGNSGAASVYDIRYSLNTITEGNFDQAVHVSSPPTPKTAGSTEEVVLSGLEPGTVYFAAVKAMDDGGNWSPSSNVASAEAGVELGTGGDDDDDDDGGGSESDFVVASVIPEDGATVHTVLPVLSAYNIAASGSNLYYFEVSEDTSFSTPVESSAPIPESNGTYTIWQVSNPLTTDEVYFWRVKVNDYPFSAVSSFVVNASAESETIAYPNPVYLSSGVLVTFTLPDEPCTIEITTVSGLPVYTSNGLSGDWQWDGTNNSGTPVSVGIYSWFIKETGANGKIVVKP